MPIGSLRRLLTGSLFLCLSLLGRLASAEQQIVVLPPELPSPTSIHSNMEFLKTEKERLKAVQKLESTLLKETQRILGPKGFTVISAETLQKKGIEKLKINVRQCRGDGCPQSPKNLVKPMGVEFYLETKLSFMRGETDGPYLATFNVFQTGARDPLSGAALARPDVASLAKDFPMRSEEVFDLPALEAGPVTLSQSPAPAPAAPTDAAAVPRAQWMQKVIDTLPYGMCNSEYWMKCFPKLPRYMCREEGTRAAAACMGVEEKGLPESVEDAIGKQMLVKLSECLRFKVEMNVRAYKPVEDHSLPDAERVKLQQFCFGKNFTEHTLR